MPITLYMTPVSGPCQTVLLTAAHLGVELVKKHLNVLAGEQMKPEFLAINPQHCVPTIDDDGFYLWESRAIVTYLVNKYAPDSPLYPKDPQARAMVDKMLNYDIGNFFKALHEFVYPLMLEDSPPGPEKVENLKKSLAILEKTLEKTPYAAGDHLTVADYSIFTSLGMAVKVFDYSLEQKFPKISAWLERLEKETPKYKEICEAPVLEFKEKLPEVKAAAKSLYSKKK